MRAVNLAPFSKEANGNGALEDSWVGYFGVPDLIDFNKQFADFVGFDSPLWTHLVQFRLPNFQWS